ncbi:MAG: hypothetical protein ACFBSC_10575 [Microcoleaceae cyanobacterium]
MKSREIKPQFFIPFSFLFVGLLSILGLGTIPATSSEKSVKLSQSPVIQPPPPEVQTPPVARVQPMDGKVNITLMNDTGANITYAVVGETDERTLAGEQKAELLGLPLPTTITTVRQDKGLIDIKATSSEMGQLEISMDEEPNVGSSELTIRVQADGQVLVY